MPSELQEMAAMLNAWLKMWTFVSYFRYLIKNQSKISFVFVVDAAKELQQRSMGGGGWGRGGGGEGKRKQYFWKSSLFIHIS